MSETRVTHEANLDLPKECDHIVGRALAGEDAIVQMGCLMFVAFSSGDAFALDLDHKVACPLCLEREKQPYGLKQTGTAWAFLNVLVHYAMMISLGVGIFPAIRLVSKWPGATIPIPRALRLVCMVLSGIAAVLTVLNLAVRGLGVPFAAKLSSRLATDWMYAWTRNPMLLAMLSLLLSVGLWYRSVWFLLWVTAIVSPGLIFFVRGYGGSSHVALARHSRA